MIRHHIRYVLSDSVYRVACIRDLHDRGSWHNSRIKSTVRESLPAR